MRVLIVTTVMAPYRVALFENIAKHVDLTVCFEQYRDNTRDDSWYKRETKSFNSIINENIVYNKFKKTVKSEIKKGYDFVIFYEYSTKLAINLIFFCQKKNIPYLINCDGAFIKKNNPIKYYIKSTLIKKATGLLANGASAIQYFLYYGGTENKIYLHDFTSLSELDLKREKSVNLKDLLLQYNIPRDGKICLAVGRYIPRKHFDFLIKLWGKVSPECYLLLVGNGVCNSEYKDLIDKNEHSNIILVNHLNKEDLFKLYQRGKVLLFPTENEIWGLVVEEAMSQGMPVIGTIGSNAVSELVKNGKNGFILSRDNPNEWVNKINEVCLNQDVYEELSEEAFCTVKERTMDNNARQIINILDCLSK